MQNLRNVNLCRICKTYPSGQQQTKLNKPQLSQFEVNFNYVSLAC